MENEITTSEAVTTPVVVFGRDDKGKPHASRFKAADAPLAERAAGLMGMQVLRLVSEEHVTLAATLPLGRIFASGKCFSPYVRADIFEKLDATPGAFTPARPADETDATAPSKPKGGRRAAAGGNAADDVPEPAGDHGTPPADFAGLTVGSLTLAAENDKPGVWYPATIVAERGEAGFLLRWLDDGDGQLPLIVRRREHLGLFPPTLAGVLA